MIKAKTFVWLEQHSRLAPISGKKMPLLYLIVQGIHQSDGSKLQGFVTSWQLEKFVLYGKDYIYVNNSFYKRKEILLVQDASCLVLCLFILTGYYT